MDKDRYFAIMGGMGLDAQMIHDADREAKRKFGPFAYFWAVAKNLPRHRALYEITLDDKPPMRHRAKTVMVANMGKITGGVDAIPTASPNDGLLDIGIMKAHTVGQGLRLVGNALLGRAHEDPMLEVHQARKMRIVPRRPQLCELDGENIGRIHEWQVEVVPQAVQILVPKDAPANSGRPETAGSPARVDARRRLAGPVLLVTLLIVGIRLAPPQVARLRAADASCRKADIKAEKALPPLFGAGGLFYVLMAAGEPNERLMPMPG